MKEVSQLVPTRPRHDRDEREYDRVRRASMFIARSRASIPRTMDPMKINASAKLEYPLIRANRAGALAPPTEQSLSKAPRAASSCATDLRSSNSIAASTLPNASSGTRHSSMNTSRSSGFNAGARSPAQCNVAEGDAAAAASEDAANSPSPSAFGPPCCSTCCACSAVPSHRTTRRAHPLALSQPAAGLPRIHSMCV